MHRIVSTFIMLLICGAAIPCFAGVEPKTAAEIYARVSPSIVVVQYTWDGELGRQELTTPGIVVSEDGMVIISAAITPTLWPEEQMKDFKIILPGDDETELDADFQGRDDRTGLSFIHAKEARKWTAIKFIDEEVHIGDPILSVGILPKDAGYKTYLMSSSVAATLRGPVPQVLVTGEGLGGVGAPVFDGQGQPIGFVHNQTGGTPLLGNGSGRGGRGSGGDSFAAVLSPPRLFVPAKDFLLSLTDPPKADAPLKIPHIGVAQLSGLQKAEAEYFDLKGQPAVQIGDVIPGFPAAKAGMKAKDIIVKMNGQPLERGDEPDEAPAIMTRKIQRMKPGDTVTFSVLSAKGQPLKDVVVTLEERPVQANRAKRFWAEDLGFSSRDIVFEDTYARRLPNDTKGVVVALIKPQSAAQQGSLQTSDLISRLNQTPVQNVDQFKSLYEAFRKDHPREAVVLEVLRGVNTQVVRIEPPQ